MSRKPNQSFRSRVRLGVCSLEERLVPANLPVGFTESNVAGGIMNATSMDFAPDGKIFVTEQGGGMQVWQNGLRLNSNFFFGNPLTVELVGERGLSCVVLDPEFASNRHLYVYYTATTPVSHNRISRFTADASGNQVVPGSEFVLLDLDPLSSAPIHNGGAMHFGPDGKLYIGVGDAGFGWNAQMLINPFGKMLRINSDGTIPTDNPYYQTTSGNNRAIWAMGLRNPWTFDFEPGTGRMFINDVGEATAEEINVGAAEANYGWPLTEGDFNQADYPYLTRPLYTYDRTVGNAITGGAFYNPASPQFAPSYVGDYFIADFGTGWMKSIDLAVEPPQAADFATGIWYVVDLDVDDSGALYMLERGLNNVTKISVDPAYMPLIENQPLSQTAPVGLPATFSVSAEGPGPFSYQWRRNGVEISGATESSYTIPSTTSADHGAVFSVVLSNPYGQVASNPAILSIGGPVVTTVTVNDGAVQRSRVNEVDVTFSSVVSFSGSVASAFTLTRSGGGAVVFSATANTQDGVTVVKLSSFSGAEADFGSLRDGRYTLTVRASQVEVDGRPMEDDFTFGDAQGLFRFFGDMNGDRRIDISDFGFFSLAFFNPLNYTASLDFNGDGRIDVSDFGQFSVRFFTTLP